MILLFQTVAMHAADSAAAYRANQLPSDRSSSSWRWYRHDPIDDFIIDLHFTTSLKVFVYP